MAVSHRRGDLVEQSGCLLLPQLLAGSDKGVHVPIASLEEHVGFGLPQDDFGDLVDVAVSGQAEARGQGLLIAADVEHLGQGYRGSGTPFIQPNHERGRLPQGRAFETTQGVLNWNPDRPGPESYQLCGLELVTRPL